MFKMTFQHSFVYQVKDLIGLNLLLYYQSPFGYI